ncbi:MAG: GntR family transcriptional regulator [Alteraurantiacibacter sp. bin_em_oilr2.035]|nr:GntR family transcriptional regulator [Alteraurantiacibacter sp. bin_em_oilr2.035]
MSPAHVLEPTYRRLKRALMEGTWPIGQKLEAMRLADEFGVSMTPVRAVIAGHAGSKCPSSGKRGRSSTAENRRR